MTFNPARFAVRQWQFTLVVFALLTTLGISALFSIPRTEDPQFPFPIFQINVVLPGADPVDMEKLVADRIEDALDGLDDVREVRSTSQDGATVVIVEFFWGVDPDRKYDEVVREVAALRGTLPQGIARLEVKKFRTSEAAFTQIALTSKTLPWRRLEKIADKLRKDIDRVTGVRETRYWGAPPSEVQVAVDLGRLAELRLPVTAIADALRAQGAEAPIGAVHAGERRYNVKTQGSFADLAQIEDTPVRANDGRVIRVRDVADVRWATSEPDHLTYFNGQRAVFITATQKDGEDVMRLKANVEKVVDRFERTLPADVKLHRGFDQADNVKTRLTRLFRDFGIALALVLITLLPLGFRAALVVMISIPLSLLIGLAALYGIGFQLNQLSIAGFILSLGLLVDDSIVVTENIARRIREGASRMEAAIDATGQIGVAVLGCTATLMLAFLPLMFLPEGSGQFIRSLPVTVLLTVGASLLVALTIIPFLASRMLSNTDSHNGNRLLQAVNGGIHKLYTPVLHRALARPWAALGLIFALCLLAIPVLGHIGSSLFPAADSRQFLVRIETPNGTSLARTAAIMRQVDVELAQHEQVDWRMANLGRGNPQIFYNQRQQESRTNLAEIFVQLGKFEPGATPAFQDRLRAKFAQIPGAQINLIVFENGPPVEAPIAVRIRGEDMAVLKRLGAQAEKILHDTPGTRDVDNPLRVDRTDLNLGVDEGKAAALGVPAGTPRRIVRLALSGEPTARFRDDNGDDYPVTVRLPLNQRHDLDALTKIFVPTGQGAGTAPLSLIATPMLQSGPARIDRFLRERQVTVTSYIDSGFLTSAVAENIYARLAKEIELPPGYTLSAGGEAEAQARSFAGLGPAILVAVGGIFAVLILEFGRFRTALVVAGVIPLGLFGAVIALWIAGYSLSFTATIGLIALIGIEIKNSILLVDFTEQLRREGVGLMDAIERAGEVRFLPVLLTSITAIGGLIPLAVERSGLYSPLAVTIIGGLIASTLLSRVATPVMYLLLARGKMTTR